MADVAVKSQPAPQPVPDPDRPPLNDDEKRAVTTIRRIGTFGALLLATGSVGAGALPVVNPATGVPVIGLLTRVPTVSLAIAITGMLLMVVAWMYYGRYARPNRERMATPGQTVRTFAMWLTPLLVVPPLFSRDVYSYLAQSEIVHRGLDPYTLGPADALGVGDPITMGVSNIWRSTPAPYGPLFLRLGSLGSAVAGNNIVLGVYLQRFIALVGVGLIIWSLPKLARRMGVHPTTALWLGAANPLVTFHLVAGVHNEALGIGLMMAGLVVGLERLPVRVQGDTVPPRQPGELLWIAMGATLISMGAMVKINAALALGFLGVMIARRWHGRVRDLALAAVGLGVVFAAVIVVVSLGSGLGFGWIGALGTPGQSRTFISPTTLAGYLAAGLGIAFGLGIHTDAIMDQFFLIGMAFAAGVTVRLLWRSFRWQLRPVIGLGVAMGVAMGLHIAVHAWWMLWAVIPLAAAAGTSRFRVAAMVASVVLAVSNSPTGSGFLGRGFLVPPAYIAALIVVGGTLYAVRESLPLWRERQPSPAPNAPGSTLVSRD